MRGFRERASKHSVDSTLTLTDRQGTNVSFYRAAADRTDLPAQSIPRHIVQTGKSWAEALQTGRNQQYVRSWLDLNPEYEYSFFGDVHAARWVASHCDAREQAAYRRLLTGSQRADLFRVLFLKAAGGVYADLDAELRRPLATFMGGVDSSGRTVPRNSSAVTGRFWPFEWLMFEPSHPILEAAAAIMVDNVLQQVSWQANRSSNSCHGPHECVIRVTGPMAYTSGVGSATMAQCHSRVRLPRQALCQAHATDSRIRRIHICDGDVGTAFNVWSCGIVRHWDCLNSDRRRPCPSDHYSRAGRFFDLWTRHTREAAGDASAIH